MNKYVATFFSHFDALLFFNKLQEENITAKLTPTPRKVSASCGTAVVFEHDVIIQIADCEVEAIYIEYEGVFSMAWDCEE